jgi:predicted signal transduction protein with EAL and GGDEF domain
MGCTVAQGFGLGRPVPADRLTDLVDAIEKRIPRVLGQSVSLPRHAG